MAANITTLESLTSRVVAGAVRVVAPIWLRGKLETNSIACLEFVKQTATRNDPASVVSAIDTFAANNAMMNIGPNKGRIIDNEIRRKKPRVMAEIGAYTGYSTVRFASIQRDEAKTAGFDSHFYSFEYSPDSVARVREIVEFAGLQDQVTVIEGAFSEQLPALHGKAVDMYFMDHYDELYVPDTKNIIASGTLRPGSLLITDNILIPGAPEYMKFLDENPQFEHVLHKVPLFGWVNDGLSVATFKE